jgi:uncharacterized protein (DUF1330 family)
MHFPDKEMAELFAADPEYRTMFARKNEGAAE